MLAQVLILGGRGRIGQSVAADLLQHTHATVIVTGRVIPDPSSPHPPTPSSPHPPTPSSPHLPHPLALDLADHKSLEQAIAASQLVIHCAGPFRYRDTDVLERCIRLGVNYLDVSDDRSFTQRALQHRQAAQAAGVTAIVNTGVFPGISNSMVRLGVEQLDRVEQIQLNYGVAGSGGAGLTVMRTTFLGLQHPFAARIDGEWQMVHPYTGRELVEFPAPYGRSAVYWFDMPETYTLAEAFPARTVITKFGSFPDLYNHLTWLTAHGFPAWLLQRPQTIEFLAKVSYRMTGISDRFTGIGVAIQAEVSGEAQGQPARHVSSFTHVNTAVAAGQGTGNVAQFLLSGELRQPGVWSVEQALPNDLFLRAMQSRGLEIEQTLIPQPRTNLAHPS
ncbi:MAG: saccharopine dehydrogenase NADP-binding domain-containing protein [Elainella sp.]